MDMKPLKLIDLLEPRSIGIVEEDPRRQQVTRIVKQPEMIEFDRRDRRKKASLRRRSQ